MLTIVFYGEVVSNERRLKVSHFKYLYDVTLKLMSQESEMEKFGTSKIRDEQKPKSAKEILISASRFLTKRNNEQL